MYQYIRMPSRSIQSIRLLSTTSCRFRQAVYDYAKVSSLVSAPQKATKLIDVRETHEYEAGNIPTSINLPLSNLEKTLKLSDAEFERQTGFPKPSKDEELVFYCKSGVRSTNASTIAEQLGFSEIGNYKGSWTDWSSQTSDSSSFTSSSTGIKNPNVESGHGDGAQGGIDLKAMNQKEEARAQKTKDTEGNKPLEGHDKSESESVTSGAELSGNKKFE